MLLKETQQNNILIPCQDGFEAKFTSEGKVERRTLTLLDDGAAAAGAHAVVVNGSLLDELVNVLGVAQDADGLAVAIAETLGLVGKQGAAHGAPETLGVPDLVHGWRASR